MIWRGASRYWSLWIALRFLVSRRRGYAGFINWVSFIGLALGVLILTVVVSVMNGFNGELNTRLLTFAPHATVVGQDEVAELEGVAGATRHFRGEAMILRGGAVNPLVIIGVESETLDVLPAIVATTVSGDMQHLFDPAATARPIVLGAPLARSLALYVGDPVTLVFSAPRPAGIEPRFLRFELVATFEVGAEPDQTMALFPVDLVGELGLEAGGVPGLRLTVHEPLAIEDLRSDIEAALDGGSVTFWTDEYGALFRAILIEKVIMFVLLGLIVAIAAFNIVASQMMLVNDKRRDVAILVTMGVDRRALLRAFLLQGSLVSGMGVLVGLLGGILIAMNADAVLSVIEGALGASIIDGTYFASIPSEIRWQDLVTIVLLSIALTGIAIVRPARRAAGANPAESLHL